MHAIVGLGRGLSRALVNGVVQRSQGSEASARPGPGQDQEPDSRLGQYSHCNNTVLQLAVYADRLVSNYCPRGGWR